MKLYYTESCSTNPYQNLAYEESMLRHMEKGECILFLWQNQNTVVIGRNQNCFAECSPQKLKQDNVLLARRRSGGGAVYHDLQNLNFSFLAHRSLYSVERQTEVILQAVRKIGIPAVRTGRNDLETEGRKFSGNAYYHAGEFCCHHGTLLLHADRERMARYLKVSDEKLSAKGVRSVKGRVAGLCEYQKGLHADRMKEVLRTAMEELYGEILSLFPEERLDWEEIKKREQVYSSDEFLYGRNFSFQYRMEKRFKWGNAEILFQVDKGKVTQADVFSDAMEVSLFERIRELFYGRPFEKKELLQAVMKLPAETEKEQEIKEDLLQLLEEMGDWNGTAV